MWRVPDWLAARLLEPLWDVYDRSKRLQTFKQMQCSQWWERGRLEEHRAQRLQETVRHAVATSPFYKRRFTEAGIDPLSVHTIEDLRGLPPLTKDEVRSELPLILSRAFRREDLLHAKTGGSTGEALQVYCDVRGGQLRGSAALRADLWSGWRLGQPKAAVWGNPPPVTSQKSRLRRWLRERTFCLDTMHIDMPAIDQFVQEWYRWRPGLLFGHAHSLYVLAEMLRERGISLRPNGIVATSMMLIKPEREVIESVFDVKVTDRYGCEEVSLIACECEEHHGMHLNAEHVVVEFLRDDDSPCPPGEDGRIVVTDLVNRGMPMLRYEVGDWGAPTERTCPCGRGLPLMERLTGRAADFLIAIDGTRVAGVSLIERTLTKLKGIRQLQLIQDELGLITVMLVPAEGWGKPTRESLTQELRDHLGADLHVEICEVSQIAREKNGKYRFSICRLGR